MGDEEESWKREWGGGCEEGGESGEWGGLNLPLVLMKTNELTRHDGIAFAGGGG